MVTRTDFYADIRDIRPPSWRVMRYVDETARTVNPNPRHPLLMNWALKLCGETSELADLFTIRSAAPASQIPPSKFVKEIGDVLWYVVRLAKESGLGDAAITDIFLPDDNGRMETQHMFANRIWGDLHMAAHMMKEAGKIAEIVGKSFYHTKEDGPLSVYACHIIFQSLSEIVGSIEGIIALISELQDVTISDVMDENIAKLKARHPDKFNLQGAQPSE